MLEAKGYRTFVCNEKPGADLQQTISKAIGSSLVQVTHSATDRRWLEMGLDSTCLDSTCLPDCRCSARQRRTA